MCRPEDVRSSIAKDGLQRAQFGRTRGVGQIHMFKIYPLLRCSSNICSIFRA